MNIAVTLPEIIVRLVLSVVVASVIGFDREHKNRPAGIKTHVLVCVGACIIALIQKKIGYDALQIALTEPKFAGVVRADEARLIAQVVSGIGFLGAGTILVQHRTIMGLTTAASLWAVAGLGLALGMGDYAIGVAGAVTVILVLVFSKRLINIHPMKKLEIKYKHKVETKEFINDYFRKHDITVINVNFKVTQTLNNTTYVNIYDIETPRSLDYANVIEDLSMNKNVMEIQLVSI
ncbi:MULTISPECIES: MgtC/SapB family protein [Lactobacillus]|uniref:MgtC/SapB family protein n=1 Tax=Lactobacillus TaxID=1578 RepID=UPI001C6A6250|nr:MULTISPECIES: MgtC/SapB family protein [Lactobacillus]MCX8720671.1 MgtC/SapB family protein [Lactobacillus sp. B4010]MCX8724097.1 MgtC/SapB family protein [Lactobacillus sp. B4005]MCX8731873.1 MgtC/SapB family protein [Lactobacillus sp. B4015]MCX8733853.1 MgtC/SapB family protein [Lactobacillus sp. B4012]QYN55997.1 MgtC/SapB family protein [Lactobacillus panisapium]